MKTTKIHNAFTSLKDSAICDISHRGGNFGFRSADVVGALFADKSDAVRDKILDFMPAKFGAFCNYLGGGLRGAIVVSDFSPDMPGYAAKRLTKFGALCKAQYKAYEDDMGLNDDEYPDGDTNYEAIATAAVRGAGTVSAY